MNWLIAQLEHLLFTHRKWVIVFFILVTCFMAWSASRLQVDAGFNKLLPLQHEYMQTFLEYNKEFGGANRVLVALIARDGNIFTADFFESLRKATDEVFFIPGVDRTRVMSLFTPNVRYTEVVEDGIAGGNVIPDDFQGSAEDLQRVRANIIKAGIVGKLVASDFSGALISAQLLEVDPETGDKLDYLEVASQLENKLRLNNTDDNIDVHIIGFAKVIGDITEGAGQVVFFFFITLLITSLLVIFYAQSVKLAALPLLSSLIAVIWQIGVLPLLGYGIDPMSILVPFLVFAIGVSHGVQMLSAVRAECYLGADTMTAARTAFRRLFVPGMIALISDCIGFITILLIEIEIIQEMAITASLGIAMLILTNLFLLPVLLSYMHTDHAYHEKLKHRARRLISTWRKLSLVTHRPIALRIILVSVVIFLLGLNQAAQIKIGDLHRGVPELHDDSRYNIDTGVITDKFSIGVDVLTVIAETKPEGCIDYASMELIDRFAWHLLNTEGVQTVTTLPLLVRRINAGWNEGSMKWRVIPGNSSLLAQSVAYVPTSTGLLNSDCSVMPVMIFTADHKAETIDTILASINSFQQNNTDNTVNFRLATGNVGVMAATNQEVAAAQFPILFYVFAAVIVLCLVTFRSLLATFSIIYPLALVSVLAYSLMTWLEIGLKVNTLPVVALGVGIGIDYGIYIYSRYKSLLEQGATADEACFQTFSTTGFSVIFTGITLAAGVITWIFSPLKFQADMGILLTFMFLFNMLAAILLIPSMRSLFMAKSE
ncbi:MAG: MMPL family transporter [Gammaproteobacteria bacterium]